MSMAMTYNCMASGETKPETSAMGLLVIILTSLGHQR
jgi:hypothetical protein